MALKKLPLYSNSLYSYETDLDDESFTLTFRWNSRLDFYVMDIENAEEEYIIQGVPLVPSYPLLLQYSLSELEGDMFLVPYETSSEFAPIPDPRYTSETHYLVYITED